MELYRQRVDDTTNAGTQKTISLPKLQAGEVAHVFSSGVQNSSGESITAQIGILEGSDFFPLMAKATVADGDASVTVGDFYIFEWQQLAVQVKGTANSKKVTLYATGEHIPFPDPPDAVPLPVVEPSGKVPTNY